MKKIEVRPNGKRRVYTVNNQPSRTQQQFKDITDVNRIMEKYTRTREITHLNSRTGRFADLSSAEGFFESLTKIRSATEAFEQLPAHVRKRFSNDPANLLQFVHDPRNYDEGVRLGIFDPKIPNPNSPPQNLPSQDPVPEPKNPRKKNNDD